MLILLTIQFAHLQLYSSTYQLHMNNVIDFCINLMIDSSNPVIYTLSVLLRLSIKVSHL